jgi:hypothetical protein
MCFIIFWVCLGSSQPQFLFLLNHMWVFFFSLSCSSKLLFTSTHACRTMQPDPHMSTKSPGPSHQPDCLFDSSAFSFFIYLTFSMLNTPCIYAHSSSQQQSQLSSISFRCSWFCSTYLSQPWCHNPWATEHPNSAAEPWPPCTPYHR